MQTKRLEALSKRRHVDLVEDGEIANGATDMGTDCAQQNAIATVPHDMPAFHVLVSNMYFCLRHVLNLFTSCELAVHRSVILVPFDSIYKRLCFVDILAQHTEMIPTSGCYGYM